MVKKTRPLNGSAPVDSARRNWFAGLAMQALVPGESSHHALKIEEINAERVARAAYKLADAMEVEATRSPQPETGSLPPETSGNLVASPESRSPHSVDLPPPRLPKGVFDPRPK
ncbi:MAG TPA: hypothetical protein VND64_03940 [Pirellulales bacterium]|nr:hypothetical protein [Pirellulales bacterium]